MGNKPRIMIESMATSGKNLFVGTTDGTICHFVLNEIPVNPGRPSPSDGSDLKIALQNKTRVSTKKPVVQIETAPELKCLLINSDGCIYAYSMMDLSPSFEIFGKLKNVSRFYVNSYPIHANPFAVEICVSYSKKRSVQLYQVQEDSIVPLKEVSLPEHPRSLALDGRHMCVGTLSGYLMVDMDSNTRQDLFPVVDTKLLVHRVAPSEFLLAAPNNLGVFVTSAGISQRPPIQWSEGTFQASYIYPYVVAMNDEFITIHSVLDQQQKQTLPFQGGIVLFESVPDKLLVCTGKDIFILVLIPYETQITTLLNQSKVDEAMELAKAFRKCMSRDKYQGMMSRIYKRAGFVHFRNLFFDAAEAMFTLGRIDAREIIVLYPGLLPDSSTVRNSSDLHSITNIHDMCHHDNVKIQECEEFLASYLQLHPLPIKSDHSDSSTNPFAKEKLENNPEYRYDFFHASLKIFSKLHSTKEILFLFQGEHEPISKTIPARSPLFFEFSKKFDVVSAILDEHGCFHARAMFTLLGDRVDDAMQQWKALAVGIKKDLDFPGLSFIAEQLGKYYNDVSLLWKHVAWILELDQHVGVSIFTKHLPLSEQSSKSESKEEGNLPKTDDIIAFLHHHPQSVTTYLEYLVYTCRVQKEKFHTHLAVLYLDSVLNLLAESDKNEEEFAQAREKLQALLKKSSLYRVSLILSKVKDTDLHEECVILLGKLGEHEKSLDILVNKMRDQMAAEEYCLTQSTDMDSRKQLFRSLLSVYLSKVSISSSKSSRSAMAVVDLLNKYAENYNAQEVLNVLPKTWSVTLLTRFLSRTLRIQRHGVCTDQLQHKLERCENNNVKKEHIQVLNKCVSINEDKICQVCNRLFQDTDCTLYPNGIAVHKHCGTNKFVCPVTGKLFKTLPFPKH